MINPGSKARLMPFVADLFDDSTLFGKVARTLSEGECMPRKELFESWEVAKRTRKRLHKTHAQIPERIVDLACGHGLTGVLLLLIEPKIKNVLAIDKRIPQCGTKSLALMTAKFPQLKDRVELREAPIDDFGVLPTDVVVCVHGCGKLTDIVIDKAIAGRAPVSVLPCCHRKTDADTGGLDGWCDFDLAVDVRRAERLRTSGYDVFTQTIPVEITPKNRLLIGVTRSA